MSVKNQLLEDMKAAMKAREQVRLDTIRYVLSRIKNVEIDAGELDEQAEQEVIAKIVKESRESVAEYNKGGRTDLAEAEEVKIAILEKYLPSQLSDAELRTMIAQVIQEQPDLSFGQIIGAVNKQAAGRADGGRIAALVKEILSK